MKKLLWVLAILAVALVVSSCLAGRYMCNYALLPEPHGIADIERTRYKADSLQAGSTAWYDSLHEAGILKDTTITGYNGYKVHAVYAPAIDPENAQGTAVVVHGYGDNHFVFLYLVRMYRDELNYNVMVPDLQYHGYSEGRAIQMGWYDRYDVARWAQVAHDIFHNDFTVVHGVSMGAATTMMMSGDPQPDYIKAYVEDCGYTSAWDQFAFNLKQSFHLPTFPILMGRVLMSYFASKYVRFVLGMKIHDTTAGFKCYRRQVLETIELDKIRFKGYAFQIEMKFTAYKCGFVIKEVPIIFINRVLGTSKMSGGIFSEALLGVIRLKVSSWFRKDPKKVES